MGKRSSFVLLRFPTFVDFERRRHEAETLYRQLIAAQQAFLSGDDDAKQQNYCHVCGQSTTFELRAVNSEAPPNWREEFSCVSCGLSLRIRAAYHLFELLVNPTENHKIFLAEAVTPLYRALLAKYPALIGSEYLGVQHRSGQLVDTDQGSIRHEDITASSFTDKSLGCVMSFDVLEHVPDFSAALKDGYRILEPGGRILFSAPFSLGNAETIVRAKINSAGEIVHLLEPQYHGDPATGKGVLCFYEFGWDLLDRMRELGFYDVELLIIGSPDLGYLDIGNIFVTGRRPQSFFDRVAGFVSRLWRLPSANH